ncbi:MAG: alpha/beta hydrolase [Anaerolineae bacterium]|nr:alpha/beta hydrolase [Anaerolineae bacterium]
MPLSLTMRTVLLAVRVTGGKPINEMTIPEARRATQARIRRRRKPIPIASIADRTIPGPAGPIPIRLYTPEGPGPFPLVIFYHGGGFVVGDLDNDDMICRSLCHGADCVVVSVDYRLAPEHKFPAAPDDCLAATRWAAEHAVEFNADPARIALAGDSAGGNLAAVTAMRIRDEGGPRLRGQLLIYPMTDYHTPPSPSLVANASDYLVTRDMIIWFWGHYLSDASQANHPHASPLRAPDLSGLPPALVITAEYDPLRDEGERYAQRLQEAGVPTVCTRYDGMIHGFFVLDEIFKESRQAVDQSNQWLRQVFDHLG